MTINIERQARKKVIKARAEIEEIIDSELNTIKPDKIMNGNNKIKKKVKNMDATIFMSTYSKKLQNLSHNGHGKKPTR
jgi:hypothetical protein